MLKRIKEYLTENALTLSTAESCTGGSLAARLTSLGGASDYFVLGCVTYADQMKAELLGVPPDIIEEHTAVSREVAELMAQGVKEISGTDLALSTTGYAGPTAGEGPDGVGTVYVGMATGDDVMTIKCVFKGERGEVIDKACDTALRVLLGELEEKGGRM